MNYRLLTILVLIALFPRAKGYCGSRGLDAKLTRAAVRAAEWLRNSDGAKGGNGHIIGFALHALRLVGHSVEEGVKDLKDEIKKASASANGSIPGGPLAVYILGVVSACEDPSKFYDFDLVTSLQGELTKYPYTGFNHPFPYSLAIIALCSARVDLGQKIYEDYILTNIHTQINGSQHASGDTVSMHIFALKCIEKYVTGQRKKKIEEGINLAGMELLNRQLKDGTFGQNVVTAALAYQGLLAAGANQCKCSETMEFLLSRQNADGSFMNLGATIKALPSLVGALPYDLIEIACPQKTPASKVPDKMIRVCVELEFNATHKYSKGKSIPAPVCVKVVNGTNAHTILKMAAAQDPCYNFTAKMTMWGHSIRSICGIHRVPAEKFYWMIRIDGQSAKTGVDYLKPGDGSTLLFVFKQLHWRRKKSLAAANPNPYGTLA